MLLSVEDIYVHYGRVPAVRGVSIGVSEGEIVCVVGPNGAGKSTTLLTISGVLRPSQGAINFDGQSIVGLTPEGVARRGISQVPEGRHVFTTLSVGGEPAARHPDAQRPGRDRGRLQAGSGALPGAGGAAQEARQASSPAASSRCW